MTNHEKLLAALRERERDIHRDLFREQGVVISLREELTEVQTAINAVNAQLERERLDAHEIKQGHS